MKKLGFLLLFILMSCGGKRVFTYDDLNKIHLKNRLDHSTTLIQARVKIEKMTLETISYIESGKSKDSCINSFIQLDYFVHETTAKNNIFIDLLVRNDKTTELITRVVQSSKRLSTIQDDFDNDIKNAILTNDTTTAIQRLRDLKVLYNTELEVILKANETYLSLASPPKKN